MNTLQGYSKKTLSDDRVLLAGGGDAPYIGPFFIKGPSTDTTAGTWTGTCAEISEYKDGLTIIYVPAVAGANTTTLKINSLSAITCYYTNSTKLTTHFSVGTPIMFTYYDGKWMRADYNSNTTYSVMTGATASAAGTLGLVPAPAAGKQNSFLKGDGTWSSPPDTWVQNALNTDGYVTGPTSSNANQVWKCDANGNPGWRDDAVGSVISGTKGNSHLPIWLNAGAFLAINMAESPHNSEVRPLIEVGGEIWKTGASIQINPSTGTLTTAILKTSKLHIPTTSGGTTYGVGTSGQVLTSNGTTVYWAAASAGTDNKVRLSNTTTTDFRPLLLGKTNASAVGTTNTADGLAVDVTDQSYVTNNIAAIPSKAHIYLTSNAAEDSPGVRVTNKSVTLIFMIGSGGTNRGIWDSTANSWTIYTDGTNTLLPIGNIGIGTTSPSSKLHVQTTAWPILRLQRNDTSNGSGIEFANNNGIMGRFGVNATQGFIWQNSASTTVMNMSNTAGTTSTKGVTTLTIGNDIGVGTAGNSRGVLSLGTGYANVKVNIWAYSSAASTDYNYYFQNHGANTYSVGVATANTAVGSTSTPVYVDDKGIIKACTSLPTGGTVSVTNNAPTLSWGGTSTVATINGTAITVKMPANPNTNTDTKVTQTSDTTSTKRHLLLSASTSTTAVTDQAYFNTGIYANASTKCLYATHYYETSDIRVKNIISPLRVSSMELANLPLFDFIWKDGTPGLHTGTSAQSVLPVLPNIVSGEETLTVDYGVLGTVAGITACREIEKLKEEIRKLKLQLEQYGRFNSN